MTPNTLLTKSKSIEFEVITEYSAKNDLDQNSNKKQKPRQNHNRPYNQIYKTNQNAQSK